MKFLTRNLCILLLLGLSGCESGSDSNNTAAKPARSLGKVSQLILALAQFTDPFTLSVTAPNVVKLGEEVSIEVTSSQQGLLWLAQVDSEDKLTWWLPTESLPQHSIEAGKTVTFPAVDSDWVLAAGKPLGKAMLVAFVTPPGKHLSTYLPELFVTGTAKSTAQSSENPVKGLQLVEAQPSARDWAMSVKTLEITP